MESPPNFTCIKISSLIIGEKYRPTSLFYVMLQKNLNPLLTIESLTRFSQQLLLHLNEIFQAISQGHQTGYAFRLP